MEELKTTGKYSIKPYKCTNCGHEEEHGTNHWGEFYNTYCRSCCQYTTWECMLDVPKGYKKPEKWKTVKLGDIVEIKREQHNTFANNKKQRGRHGKRTSGTKKDQRY